MKAKILTSILLTILITATFVVALNLTNPTNVITLNNKETSVTLTNNDGVIQNVVLSISPIIDGSNQVLFSLNPTSINNFAVGATQNIKVTATQFIGTFEIGTRSTNLKATGTDTNGTVHESTIPITFVKSFCKDGPAGGNLSITKVDINNLDGDDDEWELLDNIEIEAEVENIGDEEVKDVIVELGLFDSAGKNIANDLDFDSVDEEEIDVGDINDGDEETATFSFRIPADIDDANYKLAIKAFGDDVGESLECVDSSDDLDEDFFETISIERVNDEDMFVVVDDIIIDEQASCGDTVSGFFTVFNVGDEDQERVLITMKNAELGLDREFEITQDLDQGDDETFSFSFRIPENVADKLYTIEFRTQYDYNRGVYREMSQDTFLGFVNVIGCTAQPGPGPSPEDLLITAALSSEAKAGQDLTITATFTNTASTAKNIVIDAKAFQSWATLNTISERLLNLAPGESKSTTINFKVNDKVLGAQSFVIEATHDSKVQVQEVEVNIEGTGKGITGFAGLDLGSNNLIWVIAIVNIILIILIIIVAVRLSRG